jgi:hypothetical protein
VADLGRKHAMGKGGSGAYRGRNEGASRRTNVEGNQREEVIDDRGPTTMGATRNDAEAEDQGRKSRWDDDDDNDGGGDDDEGREKSKKECECKEW